MRAARVTNSVMGSALALALVASCGPAGTREQRFALQARGGAYVDGSGQLGLAILTTLRNGGGIGPQSAWSGSLSGPLGPIIGTLTYDAPGAGSWSAAVFPKEPGSAGTYLLDLGTASGDLLTAQFDVADGTGIAPPQPSFSEGSGTISWSPVPGAASYGCVVYGEAEVAARSLGATTSCDLSALPVGVYSASVLAYSVDLTSIASSTSATPSLPDRFDVSEARLAITRTDGSPLAATLAAAGGGFHDGTSWPGRGLAIWVSIRNADGTPTGVSWAVDVVGPGLPVSAPLRFTYPANFTRLLVWSEAVPAAPGSYGLIARSTAGSLARALTLGTLVTLDAPTGVVASAGAQGSADVAWSAVAGAASYLVTVRNSATGEYASSQWVSGTSAAFPFDTFAVDQPYAAYVAATDVDMVGGTPPTQVAITENSFQPATFVGR
jgi:hypothetical protein